MPGKMAKIRRSIRYPVYLAVKHVIQMNDVSFHRANYNKAIVVCVCIKLVNDLHVVIIPLTLFSMMCFFMGA
jgi:hypothetical protein